MPTKPLPENPNLQHVKLQAKDLLMGHRARTLEAYQRIREFHPRFRTTTDSAIGHAPFTLSDALLTIAREYGFSSWPRLKAHVENPSREDLLLPHHERIKNRAFREAVDLLDSGDAGGLAAFLAAHPDVVHRRIIFEGGNYFTNPTLLEFVAENPTRRGRLPSTIVEVAKIILDAGAGTDRTSVNSTLELVSSSRVARECGAQLMLIDVFCDYGADPSAGLYSALLHGEFAAVDRLIGRGAKPDLVVAAGTGRCDEARALLSAANAESRQKALALAAQHGHADIVRLLLDAGEDPDRYSPIGGHSHATPLHQAVIAGHERVVRLLVERGARLDIQDIHHHSTPMGWAEYSGHAQLAEYLRARSRDAITLRAPRPSAREGLE